MITCGQEQDFLVGLNTERLERDRDRYILMYGVMAKVYFAFLGGNIRLRLQPTVRRPD